MISAKTITIISSVVGGTALLALFALLTIWLYRRRFVDPTRDEEAARARAAADSDAHSDADFKRSYLFDPRKSFRLLAPPQVARIAPITFRSADAYPDPSVPAFGAAAPGAAAAAAEKKAKHNSVSPPPLSSIWRGRQWVTVSRPKTPRTAITLKSSNPHFTSFASANPHLGHHHQIATANPLVHQNPIASATPLSMSQPPPPIIVAPPPEKKTKVQRLSAMITKLKSDFMEVQL
jgi:hypothetical protein